MNREKHPERWFINVAYIRTYTGNDEIYTTGESMVLALLMHTTGAGRNSEDAAIVRKLMKDANLDRKSSGNRDSQTKGN